MPPFSFLKRWWPGIERSPRAAAVATDYEHPVVKMIPPEIKRYLEHHNWKNLSYPPYHEGYPGLVSGEEFLRHFQKVLLDRIMTSVGMPKDELKLYVEPMLVNFSELAHMLPASENHHHSGPGGLLRHSLEVAAHTLDGCLTTSFDAHETPARKSMRVRRWYVAGIAAGLLHDSGKPLSDLIARDIHGELTWNHERETLHEWSVKHNLSRYFLHWNPSRHGNHKGLSASLVRGVLTSEIRAWIRDGGHDIYEAMIDAIQGTGKSPLTELVKWADERSTKLDLNRGSNHGAGGATGVPVPRLVTDAMLRLVSDGSWKVNTHGGRIWVSTDGVYVVWNQGAEDIVDTLVADGVLAIPRSPDTLISILVDHGIAEQDPDGELYWLVTPHILRKNGKAPALRCIKLTHPDILFPLSPIPPPISISLGKEGKQTEVIAPNDIIGAATNTVADQQMDQTLAGTGSTGTAVKKEPKKKNLPRQTPPVPSAPSPGVSLSVVPEITGERSGKESTTRLNETPIAQPESDTQPGLDVAVNEEVCDLEPEVGPSLDNMLLFLSNQPVNSESAPDVPMTTEVAPEVMPDKPIAEQRTLDLRPRKEKISLNDLMKQSKPAAKEPARAEAQVLRESPDLEIPETAVTCAPAVQKDSIPVDVAEKLTSRERCLLEQHSGLAEKLIAAAKDPDNPTQCRQKVFLRLGETSFLHEDITPLVRAGWLWEDFTVEGPAITRILQRREGFILTADLSVIYCKLAGLTWAIPHKSKIPESDTKLMDAAVEALMTKAVFEAIGESPTHFVTPAVISAVAGQLGMLALDLENALFCLRDAVKIAKIKKIYVRPLPEETPKK